MVSRPLESPKLATMNRIICILQPQPEPQPGSLPRSRVDEPQIGDVDEGIVEGGEDTGDTEDQLACAEKPLVSSCSRLFSRSESTWAHTIADGGAQGDVLLGSTGDLLGGHFWILGDFWLLVTWRLRMRFSKADFSRGANLVVVVVVDLPARAVGCGRKVTRKLWWAGREKKKVQALAGEAIFFFS